MKHIKIFGLALVALMALGAMSVSSASALLPLFHASVAPGKLLSKLVGGPHKFTTSAGTVECETANGEGEIKGILAELILVVVTYGTCKVTSPLEASATVSKAHYLFHANGNVTLDNTVTISAAGICTITVGPQVLSGITYDNIAGPPMEVEVLANVKNIHYITSAFCPGGSGLHTDGTYKGNERAKEDGGEILVF